MVLAIDAFDAAINVSGVEDTISNAKHALEVAKTSLEVIQPIQEALLSKIVDPNDSAADASSMITVKTKRLPIYLDDAISVNKVSRTRYRFFGRLNVNHGRRGYG